MGDLEQVVGIKNEYVDFSDTQIAFARKDDSKLRMTARSFALMNYSWLSTLLSTVGMWAVRLQLPLAKWAVRKTIFHQFVGGETLDQSQGAIDDLWRNKVLSVLDYGAEGKSDEKDLDHARDQFLHAVEFAASKESVPVVGIKVSALSQNDILERKQEGTLSESDHEHYDKAYNRVQDICARGHQLGVKIFIDAEESWIQQTIDHLVVEMMRKFNREQVIVYNTFQMYRHDRLTYLKESFQHAQANGYRLGAKLVRGAYLEKENERAVEMGYPSPMQSDKAATDQDFNKALEFCVDHYEEIASCAATHNVQSCLLLAKLIGDRLLPRNHPHLNFCQLYGMSDHITFNLAANGYNVAKYVVYGTVEEVVPYLVRRAQENTAVKGDFSREYQLVRSEIARRKST